MRGGRLFVRLILAALSEMLHFLSDILYSNSLEFIPTALLLSFPALPQTELSTARRDHKCEDAPQLRIIPSPALNHGHPALSLGGPWTQARLSQS